MNEGPEQDDNADEDGYADEQQEDDENDDVENDPRNEENEEQAIFDCLPTLMSSFLLDFAKYTYIFI
jgi:hypothetical protein